MKKLYYTLMLAALPVLGLSFASCSDDKDLPNVEVSIDVTKGVVDNGIIYVAQGDTIQIASINVKNMDGNKGACITNVNYYWDGHYYAPAVFDPYEMVFPTTDQTALGDHTIGVSCTVLAVDKSIAVGALSYPVKVVASTADLPGNNTSNNEEQEIVQTTQLKN